MPTYAPVYKPPATQQSFIARAQKRERKRQRDGSDDADAESDRLLSLSASDEESAPRVPHPVNRTDPYYVAGWPREKPLPGANFPHAAVIASHKPVSSVEEQLAQLKPPLYIPKHSSDDKAGSLKRRHLDNLTALLHKCMLNGDWQRASRIWGLILRTEVQGRGIDVRQSGRWLIGGELLMRRDQNIEQQQQVTNDNDNHHHQDDQEHTAVAPIVSDKGFKLARDYYERLILQYPHMQRSHHDAVNALAIYPALFNVWIYEVSSRAERARRSLGTIEETPEVSFSSSHENSAYDGATDRKRTLAQIRHQELQQALPIAQRMDELMVSPPFDTSSELLHLRATIALWLSDLHHDFFQAQSTSASGTSSEEDDNGVQEVHEIDASSKRHEVKAAEERQRSRKLFKKLIAGNFGVSKHILDFLDEDEDEDDSVHEHND